MKKIIYKWVLRGGKMQRTKEEIKIKVESKPTISRVEKCKDLVELRTKSEPSEGEKAIIDFLVKNCVKFQREYYCNKLFNPATKKLLFFDFYLPEYKLMIEFDGQYHFQPINGHEALRSLNNRDRIKNKFCSKNGFRILRIPYWKQAKIEETLCKYFDKHF